MSAEPLKRPTESMEEPQKSEKAERGRSRIEWPYYSLDEASKLAKGIFDLGGNCQIDQLAGHLSQTATGGGFRLKVQAARTFGLVNSAQGQLTLTDLGSEIVDPDGDRQAKADAFMRVPLYSAIYEQFKGKTLPGIIGLENAMVHLGVAIKQKDKARQAFLRSAKEAITSASQFSKALLRWWVTPFPLGEGRSTLPRHAAHRPVWQAEGCAAGRVQDRQRHTP